jgi:type III secretion protein T
MNDSYLTQVVTSLFSQADPRAMLSLLFLFLGRMLPIIAMSPFFGSRVLPNPTKVFFAMTLFVVFLPQFLLSVSTPLVFNLLLVLLVLKELFVGLILGFMISIPFIIVQAAGMMIDHQRGGASLMVNDPTIQNQSSPIGTLFNLVLITIFFAVDGPFIFLDAIFQSYEVIPPDQFLNAALFGENSPFWAVQMRLLNEVMVIAVRLAAPALIAILMTDVFLGIANRLAPQVQITFLGLPLKSLLGLAVICFGWFLMTAEFAKQSYYWVNVVREIVNMFRISG